MDDIPAVGQIEEKLLVEIAVIAGLPPGEVDPARSLAGNGVNSMGFLGLVLFVKETWGIELMESGLGPDDVKSITALASKLHELIRG